MTINWIKFKDQMPEPGRQIMFIWSDPGRGEAMPGADYQEAREAGVEADVISDESPDLWLYHEFGQVAPDGFGVALYRGREAEKLDRYEHAAVLDSGAWVYITDLVKGYAKTLLVAPIEYVILEREPLPKAVVAEDTNGRLHKTVAAWKVSKD